MRRIVKGSNDTRFEVTYGPHEPTVLLHAPFVVLNVKQLDAAIHVLTAVRTKRFGAKP